MASNFDFAALLGGSHPLEDGSRVRLRLARSSDAWAIGRLLAEAGGDEAAGQLTRLLRFDPRRDCVLCATALIDGRETLVGVGSIAVSGATCPDLLVVDPSSGEGVRGLLGEALLARAVAAAA